MLLGDRTFHRYVLSSKTITLIHNFLFQPVSNANMARRNASRAFLNHQTPTPLQLKGPRKAGQVRMQPSRSFLTSFRCFHRI
jgi:hypothetical protein